MTPASTGTIPQSPHVRNRIVNPEQASPMLKNRDVLGSRSGVMDSSNTPAPIRLGTSANTTKPTTMLPQGSSTTVANTLMPQSPTMRVFRNPRNSKPPPPGMAANTIPQ